MKAAIISLGSKSSKWTAQAMKKYFTQVDELDLKDIEINFSGKNSEVLYKGKEVAKYDCIFVKGSFRYAPLLRSITSLLGGKAYMPFDPDSFTIAHDKLLTQLRMQQYNIPMPRTYLSATIAAARKILEKINYPIIMKFPQGTQGKGVMFADSYASASSMLDALSALKQPFIIQEYIDTGGTDIRAIVIGDRVVAAMKRKSAANEVRSNIHAGGVGEGMLLDSYTQKVAIDTAKAIGAEICGVDLLESAKGPVAIEVNISPGLQGITAATKIDVGDNIAKFLFEQTKEFCDSNKKKGTERIMSDIESEKKKEIIRPLDFRGTRILLPEIVTKVSGIKDNDDVQISVEKKKILIKKFEVS